MEKAWIYILSHVAGQNVKVGVTKVSPESRQRDYVNTYQLNDFNLYKTFSVPLISRQEIEKSAHRKLKDQGFQLSSLDTAREIFACTPEIAEIAVKEAIYERDILTEILINIYKDKFFVPLVNDRDCVEEIIEEERQRASLFGNQFKSRSGYVLNNSHCEQIQKKLFNFDKDLNELTNKEIEKSLESFYNNSKNFNIKNWYNFFKKQPHFCEENFGYYPPFEFWSYLAELINLIKHNKFIENQKKINILAFWQSQILDLLDKDYVSQNILYLCEGKKDKNIKCNPDNLNFQWTYTIAPYLKPFLIDSQVDDLLSRFNRLGIIYSRGIDQFLHYICEIRNINFYKNNIHYGAFMAAQNFEECKHFHLRGDLVRSLVFFKNNNLWEIINELDDEAFLKDNEFNVCTHDATFNLFLYLVDKIK